MKNYNQLYLQSLSDPESFWAEAAENIHWYRKWDRVIDRQAKPVPCWFPGAELNTCYNALDRHLESGQGEKAAIIYDSPVTGQRQKISYLELQQQVSKFAGVLTRHGAKKGDRVLIYMPMIPEAVIAMLACARIGAIHSVVFGGFAANELATRIDDAKPNIIVSAGCGIEPGRIVEYKPLLDEAANKAIHKITTCIIKARPETRVTMINGRDFDWDEEISNSTHTECVPVSATDPLYILYTSGTTGQPKGIIRDNGGHAVAMHWSLKNIYNINQEDVYWAASDIGWAVGHSYLVYAPLISGCTTILYEGKPVDTPDPGAFWRVINEHNVKVLFTAPTAFRAIKREDPDGEYIKKYDLSCMDTLFLAGERCDPDTLFWAREKLQKPVVDHWWQTETGWAIAANPMGIERLEIKPGSPTVAMPGYDVRIFSEEGEEMAAGETGNIVIKLPMPPSCLPSLWGDDQRFIDTYLTKYDGFYLTGDGGYKDADGYLWIMGRIDDVINVAGHRLSTGAIEEVLSGHEAVAECAVIGVTDELKGQLPLGLIVLKAGVDREEDELARELVQRVRNQIGPVAAFKLVKIVERLPKTRSGKILRGTMASIADGTEWKMPATIDDPAILDNIKQALKTLGYALS
jgi:propionyl-CoA synthetase